MGAGFAISMRDLEIRGAGNLLGTQQSGHIAAIGYEMYCQLLEDAVRQVQNLPPRLSADVDVDLPVEAYLPNDYVPDLRHKIDLYRRIARIDNAAHIDEIRDELIDRFGPPPLPAERMLELAELRLDAAAWQIAAITSDARFIVLHYTQRDRDRASGAKNRDSCSCRRQSEGLHPHRAAQDPRLQNAPTRLVSRDRPGCTRWRRMAQTGPSRAAFGLKPSSV